MALFLVDSGKVVPGLATDDDGRWRSWWWPLPAIGDRDLIASLLDSRAFAHLRLVSNPLAMTRAVKQGCQAAFHEVPPWCAFHSKSPRSNFRSDQGLSSSG